MPRAVPDVMHTESVLIGVSLWLVELFCDMQADGQEPRTKIAEEYYYGNGERA